MMALLATDPTGSLGLGLLLTLLPCQCRSSAFTTLLLPKGKPGLLLSALRQLLVEGKYNLLEFGQVRDIVRGDRKLVLEPPGEALGLAVH